MNKSPSDLKTSLKSLLELLQTASLQDLKDSAFNIIKQQMADKARPVSCKWITHISDYSRGIFCAAEVLEGEHVILYWVDLVKFSDSFNGISKPKIVVDNVEISKNCKEHRSQFISTCRICPKRKEAKEWYGQRGHTGENSNGCM